MYIGCLKKVENIDIENISENVFYRKMFQTKVVGFEKSI